MATPAFDFRHYEYTSLPSPSSIRLLRRLEGHEYSHEAAICEMKIPQYSLITVDLDLDPDYKALSYTWGDPGGHFRQLKNKFEFSRANRWPISVDDRLFYITKNLYNALQELTPSEVHQRLEPYNKTRLIEAAEEGQTNDVREQLEKGAEVDAVDNYNQTGLHYAAENGHVDVVEMLLKAGSNPNLVDSKGRIPLDCCVQRKRGSWTDVAQMLLKPPKVDAQTVATEEVRRLPIWIDAICINQSDILERNMQVAMMGRIYSSAQSVVVWLGGEIEEETDAALNGILRVNECASTHSWQDSEKARAQGETPSEYHYGHGCPGESLTTRCDYSAESTGFPLATLEQKAWFSRIWVIQELALARDVVVLWGSRKIDWMELFKYIHKNSGEPCDSPQGADCRNSTHVGSTIAQGLMNLWVLADIRLRTRPDVPERWRLNHIDGCLQRTIDSSWNARLSLPVLVCLTFSFSASDPRDKIFALLGIARFSDAANTIVADYSRSVVDIYTQFGRMFVEAPGDNRFQDCHTAEMQDFEPLEGLSFIQVDAFKILYLYYPAYLPYQPAEGLPSWVPDFQRKLSTRRIFRKDFAAAGDSRYRSYEAQPENTLRLDAGFFDEIVAVDAKQGERGLCSANAEARTWLRFINDMDPTYPAESSSSGRRINRAEALWRTLMLDNPRADADQAKRSFREWLRRSIIRAQPEDSPDGSENPDVLLLHALVVTDDSNSLPSPADLAIFRPFDENDPQDDILQRGVDRWRRRFDKHYLLRRLCRTRKGYLGLAPWDTKAGDQVWILAGARTPFVLRSVSGGEREEERGDGDGTAKRFRLVGETYVHGIMQGEAVKREGWAFETVDLV